MSARDILINVHKAVLIGLGIGNTSDQNYASCLGDASSKSGRQQEKRGWLRKETFPKAATLSLLFSTKSAEIPESTAL